MNDLPKSAAQPTRRLTPGDRRRIAKLNTLKRWKKLWKENPQLMESFRVKATETASMQKQSRREKLKNTIATWPKTMTTTEIKALVAANIPKDYNPKSAFNRMRKLNLCAFDPALGVWVNNCRESTPS